MDLVLETRSHQLVAARPGRLGETGISESTLAGVWESGFEGRRPEVRVIQEGIGDEEGGTDVNNGEEERIFRTW